MADNKQHTWTMRGWKEAGSIKKTRRKPPMNKSQSLDRILPEWDQMQKCQVWMPPKWNKFGPFSDQNILKSDLKKSRTQLGPI